MHPQISIIVTTYNRQKQLGETIHSILAQTFTDFELIVVDNYSEYNFIEFLDSFNDKRIIGYQNHNNGIIAVNRNFGINHSNGNYLAFCDDDDTWLPNKLQKQVDAISQSSITGNLLVYSNSECFGPQINSFITKKKKIATINNLVFENQITLSSVLLTKSNWVVFNENPELKAVEDFFLWLCLIHNQYSTIFIEDALIRYYINSSSESRLNRKYMHLKFLQSLLLIKIRYPNNRIKNLAFVCSAIIQLSKFYVKSVIEN